MSPVGSNMRAGSSVLSTKEVSTTRDDDADEDDDPVPPVLPLLPQAASPTVTASTQPDGGDRWSRMGASPFTIGQTLPPRGAAGQYCSVSTAKRVCDSFRPPQHTTLVPPAMIAKTCPRAAG